MSAKDRIPFNFRIAIITGNTAELRWGQPPTWDSSYVYQVSVRKAGGFFFKRNPEAFFITKKTSFIAENLEGCTEYEFCVRGGRDYNWSDWSNRLTAKTDIPFSWRECPGADGKKGYQINKANRKIVTAVGNDTECTIVGTTPFPLNKVTIWKVKILKSKENDGRNIFVGVAPMDANLDGNSSEKCGWYLGCYRSGLWSGPPHTYSCKGYGPRKEEGTYVKDGDNVGVIVDTGKGEISFVLNNINYGPAFKGVPLDKPLAPCVILKWRGDSVQLGYCETRESTGTVPKAECTNENNQQGNSNHQDVPSTNQQGNPNPNLNSNQQDNPNSNSIPRDFRKLTLNDSLLEAGFTETQAHNICHSCYKKAEGLDEEGKLPEGLTVDDAAVIAMYTFDFGTGDFEHNPCTIINKAIREKNTGKVDGLIYLLITALRKLPRYKGDTLYRGVSYEVDKVEYTTGNTVTWPTFSSSSPDMEDVKKFLTGGAFKGGLGGTMFIFDNAWGYDIQPYSLYQDDFDVILEPGTQFKVVSVISTMFAMVRLSALDSEPDTPLDACRKK